MSRKHAKKPTAPLVRGLRAPSESPGQDETVVDGDKYDITVRLVLGRMRQPEGIYLALKKIGAQGMISKKLGLEQVDRLIRTLQQYRFVLWGEGDEAIRDDMIVDRLEYIALAIRDCEDCDKAADLDRQVCPHHLAEINRAVESTRAQLLRWRYPLDPSTDTPAPSTDTSSMIQL